MNELTTDEPVTIVTRPYVKTVSIELTKDELKLLKHAIVSEIAEKRRHGLISTCADLHEIFNKLNHIK